MKINFFKIKKHFKKGGLHINPDIYWEILLIMAFIIVLLFFSFDFSLFQTINKGFTTSNENAGSQPKTINKDRIDKVLQYFSDREKKSTQVLNSPVPVVDPSL
jgi:uncharacterized membrane protein